jgi:hypothetical protein
MDEESSKALRATFVAQYGLDPSTDADVKSSLELAKGNPDGFVLKPQREGGGKNSHPPDFIY